MQSFSSLTTVEESEEGEKNTSFPREEIPFESQGSRSRARPRRRRGCAAASSAPRGSRSRAELLWLLLNLVATIYSFVLGIELKDRKSDMPSGQEGARMGPALGFGVRVG